MSKIISYSWTDPRGVFGTGIDWKVPKEVFDDVYADKTSETIILMPDAIAVSIEPVDFSFLADYIIEYELVGSRITVDPPPTDTDLDVLIFCEPDLDAAISACHRHGFDDDGTYKELPSCFWSVRKGELNLILTNDKEFYDLFCLASYVCKTLNVVNKKDRITVFQAILYGTKK